MSELPPELITNILTRLPVKSLLQFRCVSKSVKAVIDSHNFIKAHLKSQKNSNVKLIIRGYNTLLSLDFTSIGITQPQHLDHPFTLNYRFQELSSLHGLIMIYNNVSITDNALWNPSTKQFLQLPVFDFNPGTAFDIAEGAEFHGGFGYDCSTDDYKVVRIAQRKNYDGGSSVVSQTMIYSLKSGVWKKGKESCSYWLIREETGTFAGGALNWIAGREPFVLRVVIALNLSTERFQQLPLPGNLGNPLNLAFLEECLCLLSTPPNPEYCILDHVDVWIMKDYGVKQSWVKLFSIKQLTGSQHFTILRPIAFSVTGKEVLLEMDFKSFMWYNLENKSARFAKISVGLDNFESFVCLGTLVPLYGGCDRNDTSGAEDKRGKERAQKKRGDDFLSKGFKLKL